jgi:anti-sigma B factor antagonist
MADSRFGYALVERRGVPIVKVFGEVDLLASHALCNELAGLATDQHARVVVDLSWVPFFDSTGLSALAAGHKRMQAHDGELRVVVTDPNIRIVFQLGALYRAIPIFDNLEDAISWRGSSELAQGQVAG